MRIGISCYPTFGGSGVVATELAHALAATGDEVHVFSYALPARLDPLCPNLYFHQVAVPHYPLFEYPPYSLALASKMAEVARYRRLELLHVHYAVPNAVSAILAREIVAPYPLPVVTTLHGTDVTLVGNDPSYLETTRWALQRSEAVTAVSEWLRERTVEQLGLDRGKIQVIPNFIVPGRFERLRGHPGARRWARTPEERLLVHVSNFRPIKRVGDVLEVFRIVEREVPCRLLFVGDGPERARLELRVRELGLEDRVLFLGSYPVIEEILVGADLFLLPSDGESFGLAALEALACEVPVIAARAGGVPEVIQDGVVGYLFPVGDIEGMARGALQLLTCRELLDRFRRAARLWAVERFPEASVVERYRQLYQKVLRGESCG
jgi:N-acetyl-alpha-D-glucosaminyl L-malate synthase BshA